MNKDKLNKLISLSSSPNKEEALAAAQKVCEELRKGSFQLVSKDQHEKECSQREEYLIQRVIDTQKYYIQLKEYQTKYLTLINKYNFLQSWHFFIMVVLITTGAALVVVSNFLLKL